jgi:hypothetical protein
LKLKFAITKTKKNPLAPPPPRPKQKPFN